MSIALGDILRMKDNRLFRRVLLSCIPAAPLSVFNDARDLNISWALLHAAEKCECYKEVLSCRASALGE